MNSFKKITVANGDKVSIFGGNHVWVDHLRTRSLSQCNIGLIDAINGFTPITLSNNCLIYYNKVMGPSLMPPLIMVRSSITRVTTANFQLWRLANVQKNDHNLNN